MVRFLSVYKVQLAMLSCTSIVYLAGMISLLAIRSSVGPSYHLFHDPAKDVDLMGEMERGLLTA